VSDDKVAHEEFREATGEQLSAKERIETELLKEREKFTDSIATLVRERDGLVSQLKELRRGRSEDGAVIEDLQSRSATSKKELSEIAQRLESAGAEKGSLLKEKDDLVEKCSESAAKLDEVTSAARLHTSHSVARRHTSHIEALGAEVQQLRQENEGLCRLMKTLECDHAEVLKRVRDEKSLEITALEEKM
jgi:chromosome segregation ATPase